MSSVIRGEDGFETSAGGIVLQTRYALLTIPKSISVAAMTVTEIDELTVNITPKSAQSVFKIELTIPHEADGKNPENIMFSFTRNGTYIQPENVGNRNAGITSRAVNYPQVGQVSHLNYGGFVFVDEPATTNPIVYKAAIKYVDAQNLFINRTAPDTDVAFCERGMTAFIITELSGT